MNRYETVIRIISYGDDVFEAGEKAGELLDMTRVSEEFQISCEPTRQIKPEEENRCAFAQIKDILVQQLVAA